MIAIGLGLAVFLSGMAMIGDSAQAAKYKQQGCSKLAKKVRKAKNRNQKLRAKFNLKACKKKRKAYNRLKNARFIGVRSDGEPIDITLCANGKSADDLDSEFGQVFRKGWRIDIARFKGKYFSAGFAAKLNGGERVGSIRLTKRGWEVGLYSLGRLSDFGPATRTNATKLCKTL